MAGEIIETANARWFWQGKQSFPRSVDPSQLEDALQRAREAKSNAYAPYSKFSVGATVLMDGELYFGSNVENASYGATMCAERSALFAAASTGKRHLDFVVVTTSAAARSPIESRSPCGMCRQVISEFAHDDTFVLLDAGDEEETMVGEIFPFDDLLPFRFRLH